MLKVFINPLILVSSLLFGNDIVGFQDYESVNSVFNHYLEAVDNKNIKKMSEFFYYGGSDRTTFFFGDNPPVVINTEKDLIDIFTSWKKSERANFERTRIDNISIAPASDYKDARLCIVDVTYSRLNKDDIPVNQARAAYHFYRDKTKKLFGFWEKWSKWKIYMVVDLDLNR